MVQNRGKIDMAETQLEDDLDHLESYIRELELERDQLKDRLNDALHSAHRLARLACSLTGADANAVRKCADRMADAPMRVRRNG